MATKHDAIWFYISTLIFTVVLGGTVAKATDCPKEAWAVLQWLVSDENLIRLVDDGGNTVSRPRINVMAKYMQNPIHRMFVQILANQEFMFTPIPKNFFIY